MPIHDWTRVHASIFHDFHHSWISTIKNALNRGCLPAKYYAMADGFLPGDEGVDWSPLPQTRFTSVAESDQYATRRNRIAVRHSDEDRLVALLEVLAPGDKTGRAALRTFVSRTLAHLDAGIQLLIVDHWPPTKLAPQGIHAAIWSEMTEDDFQLPSDKTLTLAAYTAGVVREAYVEPVAVGDTLPEMPLFLEPERYVPVPLEATYQAAFEAVPRRWRDVLQPPSP